MASRMRRPETAKIDLSLGDWLLVKKHLTAGEKRQLFSLMLKQGANGDQLDSAKVGLAKILVYLLDWSITDADDKPVVIRDQPVSAMESALDALDPESFTEILRAIEQHDDAMEKARAAEKNGQGTEIGSPAISPSAA